MTDEEFNDELEYNYKLIKKCLFYISSNWDDIEEYDQNTILEILEEFIDNYG